MKSKLLIATAIAALALPASALASGGIYLTHVGITGGHLNATWTGPSNGVEFGAIQIAVQPYTGSNGDFFEENRIQYALISQGQSAWLDSDQLELPKSAGTYTLYARVDGWDKYLYWEDFGDGYGFWAGGDVYSPVTPFSVTAVAHRYVIRAGHYVTRRVHGKKVRRWVKPVYGTRLSWQDS